MKNLASYHHQFICESNLKNKLEEVRAGLQTSTCWSITVHSSEQLLCLCLVFQQTSARLQFIKNNKTISKKVSMQFTQIQQCTTKQPYKYNNNIQRYTVTFTHGSEWSNISNLFITLLSHCEGSLMQGVGSKTAFNKLCQLFVEGSIGMA